MDTFLEIAGIVAQAALAAAAIWLGWRVHRYTQRSEKINQRLLILSSTNQLNEIALSSDENLMAIDRLYNDGRDTSLEAMRSRWAMFTALQVHQQVFLAHCAGYLDDDTLERNAEQVLDLLLIHEEAQSLVSERGFNSAFVEYCRNRAACLK